LSPGTEAFKHAHPPGLITEKPGGGGAAYLAVGALGLGKAHALHVGHHQATESDAWAAFLGELVTALAGLKDTDLGS